MRYGFVQIKINKMKKLSIIISAFAIALVAISCGNTTTNKDTHAHDDGSVHEAHSDAAPAKSSTKQETFKVDAKAAQGKAGEDHESHKDHEGHDHSAESNHKH